MRPCPGLLAALLLTLSPVARAEESVRVTNLPRIQRVEVERFPELQRVEAVGHAPVTGFLTWAGRRVAPTSPGAGPDELERFHELGVLDATGFGRVTVTVAGRHSGSRTGAHQLELILLPEVDFVIEAWKKDGVVLLAERIPLELRSRAKGLFEGGAPARALRFPRHRAFLRNPAPQTVELDLYLMLGE